MQVHLTRFFQQIKLLTLFGGSRSKPADLSARLRDATPDDLSAIREFFTRAGDPNVLPRPEEDYRRSVDAGLFYVIEIGGVLVAAAGVFYLDEHNAGPLEMGSCYVAPVARGYGLQKILAACRIAAATIFLDVEAPLYTAIKPGNAASLKSVKDVGFEPFLHAEPLLIEPCVTCDFRPAPNSGRICCCDFFHIPLTHRCNGIRSLLASKTRVLSGRESGRRMMLELAIQLLEVTEYREIMRDFADSPECRNA
jgi:hypothetical protein